MNVLCRLTLLAFCLTLCASEYPLPIELGPTNTYGRDLQRSMRLMANSSPSNKRTVKVLFYGQSITQEIWTNWLRDYLRERYGNANLVITNLAVGYTSEILWRPATADIPNFYPDLMIFHDYGSLQNFDDIVSMTRRQTVADILIQTDHINHPEDLQEPTDPQFPGGLPERAARNYVSLPEIARKYGAELGDVRTYWKRYLEDYQIPTENLLRDPVHPNLQGSFLMTELLKPYLRADESFPSQEWEGAEKTYRVGSEIDWQGDELSLQFEGNRVDAIAEGNTDDVIDVTIDGKRPSEFPELYHFTRVDWYPGAAWLAILKVGSQKPLLDERWTATITEFSTNNGVPFARFAVSGSKTGFDGEGSITERFVSNSGRVIIEPADWLMLYWASAYYTTTLKPLPVGHEIHWDSLLLGQDEFKPQVADSTVEAAITIAQGLGNGPHTLTLRRRGAAPISAIRVFNPLARKQPRWTNAPTVTVVRREAGHQILGVNAGGRYVLEQSSDGKQWTAASAAMNDLEVGVESTEHVRFFRVRGVD